MSEIRFDGGALIISNDRVDNRTRNVTMTKQVLVICLLAFVTVSIAKQIPNSAEEPNWKLKPIPDIKSTHSKPGLEEAARILSARMHGTAKDAPTSMSLQTRPTNFATFSGQDVILQCIATIGSNFRVQWWEFAYNPNGDLISDNEQVGNHPQADRYSIDHETNETFNLRIRNVTYEDGGTYLCQDTLSGPPQTYRGSCQLIVLSGPPNCTSTIPSTGVVVEGNIHSAECTLDYNGNIRPIHTWFGPGEFNTGSASGPNTVWSGVSYMAHREQDTGAFRCLNNFTGNFFPTPVDQDDTIPDLSYTYQTNQQFVYWGPTNTYSDPDKTYYEVGETLTCHTDAFPSAAFTWSNTRTGEVFNSQGFVIAGSLEGTSQIFRCNPVNTIGGYLYSENIFVNVTVNVRTTTPSPTAPVTTTPPPAVQPCFDLSGLWASTYSTTATLCLNVDRTENGETSGTMKNGTDTYQVEVVGRTAIDLNDQLSYTTVAPGNLGVNSFVGECHNCFGEEQLLVNAITRVKGQDCGFSGPLTYSDQYTFYRQPGSCPNLPP